LVRRGLIVLCILFYSVSAAFTDDNVLTVAAAANLASSLPTINGAFKEHYPGVSVKAVTGSSGALSAQILNGAPFDLFLSADMSFPNRIFREGGASAPPEFYAEGILVLVSAQPAEAATLEDFILTTEGPVIIPNPQVAPYGKAAVEFLKSTGLYDIVESRIAYTQNITQTVHMILSTAGIGFISKSALHALETRNRGTRVYTSFEVDPSHHDPIRQGCIITNFGKSNPWARRYVDFLILGEGRMLLQELGYRIDSVQ
jgi:molybdate transport system substrate-binding protein